MRLIRLYVRDGCEYCHRAKQFLRAHGIAYVELNVRDEINLEQLRALGTEFVPTFVIDDMVITGFSEYKLRPILGLT